MLVTMKPFARFKMRVHEALDRHGSAVPALAVAGAGIMAMGAFATGDASAAVTNTTIAFYGLTVVDWVLIVIGAIGFLVGLYLRDIRVIAVGVILVILGAVANYLGV